MLCFLDASKATFTASPSSCFLANRNKAAITSSDSSVKNETQQDYGHLSLQGTQHGLGSTIVVYQGTDADSFTLSGKNLPHRGVLMSKDEIMQHYINTLMLWC